MTGLHVLSRMLVALGFVGWLVAIYGLVLVGSVRASGRGPAFGAGAWFLAVVVMLLGLATMALVHHSPS